MIQQKCLAVLGALMTTLWLGTPAISQPRPTVISRVNIVDVVDGRIIPSRTVAIRGDAISIIATDSITLPGARYVDGRGKFLMPGLWDMHSHLEASGASSLALYVANGVTTVRDMGSELEFILGLRNATSTGQTLGPRIFAAGPILDNAPGEWALRRRVKTPAEGRAAVQLLKRRGIDVIKVHDHTPRDVYFAIAQEARAQNLPLAGHVPFGVTLAEAIEAGQRDIEHLSNLEIWKSCPGVGYQPGACKALFDTLARRGVWQGPTLLHMSEIATIGTPASPVSAEQLIYATRSLRDMWAGSQSVFATPKVARELQAAAKVGAVVASDMAKAGVGVFAGCDMMVPGFCVHDELSIYVEGGMSPLTALQTATINPARYFGLEQISGSVATGRRADLVLLDGNPLTDIKNARRIRAVIVAGRYLDRAELDRLLRDARSAASRR
jgi:imidazolonepropionase-like amidohydrolase